jgi:hypothetical protein
VATKRPLSATERPLCHRAATTGTLRPRIRRRPQ